MSFQCQENHLSRTGGLQRQTVSGSLSKGKEEKRGVSELRKLAKHSSSLNLSNSEQGVQGRFPVGAIRSKVGEPRLNQSSLWGRSLRVDAREEGAHCLQWLGNQLWAETCVILCAVMKPDERSPACRMPAVVLKNANHRLGPWNREQAEDGGSGWAPHSSASL